MVKVKLGSLQPDSLPLHRGSFYTRMTRWGAVIQKWPRPAGKAKTPYQRFHQGQFGLAAYYAAGPEGHQLASAIELAKGVQMVPRDFLTMAALGRQMAVTLEDGTKLVPGVMATSNPNYILDLITTTVNSVLYRASSGWLGVAPQADGQILSFIGGQVQWANPGTPPASGGWVLIGSWTHSVNVSGVAFNVQGYSEAYCIFRAVTCSASTFRTVVASVDGGINYRRTSGDYVEVETVGTEAAKASWGTHVTGASAARSLIVWCFGLNVNGSPKPSTASSGERRLFVQSTAPVTHLRCEPGTGNFTGGSIWVLGRV